jgi:hypothetical protein
VVIPFNPTAPFRGAIIGNDLDDTVEKMVHMALTKLCGRNLANTADTPLALFPV